MNSNKMIFSMVWNFSQAVFAFLGGGTWIYILVAGIQNRQLDILGHWILMTLVLILGYKVFSKFQEKVILSSTALFFILTIYIVAFISHDFSKIIFISICLTYFVMAVYYWKIKIVEWIKKEKKYLQR